MSTVQRRTLASFRSWLSSDQTSAKNCGDGQPACPTVTVRPVTPTRLFVDQIADHQDRAGVPGAVVEAVRLIHLLVALAEDFRLVRLLGMDFQLYCVDG